MPVKYQSEGPATGKYSIYHRLDVRMRHCVELVDIELEIRTNIDICALFSVLSQYFGAEKTAGR
jgi:hypothetical protein